MKGYHHKWTQRGSQQERLFSIQHPPELGPAVHKPLQEVTAEAAQGNKQGPANFSFQHTTPSTFLNHFLKWFLQGGRLTRVNGEWRVKAPFGGHSRAGHPVLFYMCSVTLSQSFPYCNNPVTCLSASISPQPQGRVGVWFNLEPLGSSQAPLTYQMHNTNVCSME